MILIPDCIIVAGGLSSRMEHWKPALPWGKVTMLEKTVQEALSAGCRVIVAGGYRFPDLIGLLENPDTHSDVIFHFSRGWNKGMDETVRSALDKVFSEYFFVVPVDMPLIIADDYRNLAVLAEKSGMSVLRPVFSGIPGHPVLMNQSVAEAIRCSVAGTPLRVVLNRFHVTGEPWEHDGVIRDIDTLSQYSRLKPANHR